MNKTKTVPIRMTEREYIIIKKKAELLEMSVSEYIRTSGLNRQVSGFKRSDLDIKDAPLKGQMELSYFI